MFTESDLRELLEIMTGLNGKFMLMMYPNDDIRRFSDSNGWTIHRIERNLVVSKDKKRMQEEWMVTNY